ncbi:MAG: tetratricopeptide repeat protein [Blastocatellia bacterium]|nr:tetratricopeptide repeat protein [Blastocatellia bacterium]
MKRVIVSVILSALISFCFSIRSFAQDAATKNFLQGLSGTRRDVAEIVAETVRETNARIVTVGSWVSGTKYNDPLLGGVSDHDMRLVMTGTSEDAAMASWRNVRSTIVQKVRARFKDPATADQVLKSINLYPPDEILAGIDDADEALLKMKNLGVNPNLGDEVVEGLWGKGSKAFRDAYESTSGRMIYAEGGAVRSGFADLLPLGETRAIYTIGGSANSASQFVDKTLDALRKGDAKTVRKQLERLNQSLRKARSLAGIEQRNHFDDILKKLKDYGDDIEGLRRELATNKQLVAEISNALPKAKLDAELLKRFAESSKPRDLKIIKDMLEEGTGRWARVKDALSKASSHVPWGALMKGMMAFFVYLETVDISSAAGRGDYEQAFEKILTNLGFVASLPAGILSALVTAIITDAKESGYIFVTRFQDCEDLIAGIYSVKGREEVSDVQKIEINVDRMAREFTKEEQVRALVALHARNAARRNVGEATEKIDQEVENRLNERCGPNIIEKWRNRRAEIIGAAAETLLRADAAFNTFNLTAAAGPEPVILSGTGALKGDVTINARFDGDVSEITQALNEFTSTLRPLGGKNHEVAVSINHSYIWLLDGREIAGDSQVFAGVGQVFDAEAARRTITITAPGEHTIEFQYILEVKVHSICDDVLAAKRFIEKTFKPKTTFRVTAIDGDWKAAIKGPDSVKPGDTISLSADLSPAVRQLKNVSLRWSNETARVSLPAKENVSFTPQEATAQRFALEVFAEIGGVQVRIAGADKTVAVEGEEKPAAIPGDVKFSGSVPDNWEGGNTPDGFVLKRKPAKIKGPCGWDSSVGATLTAKYVGISQEPRDDAQAMTRADARFKARRQGDTPNDPAVGLFMVGGREGVSAFSMGDYQGAIAEFAIWMRRGSGGFSGYTGSYFGANGAGDVVKQGGVISFSYHVNGGGCWDNSDRAYLVTQGIAAQEEAHAILASLRPDDEGLLSSKPYEGPKYDGSDLPKVVLAPSSLQKLKVGEPVKIEAIVENAKPEDSPFTYNWSGTFDGTTETAKRQSSVHLKPTKPGKYSVSVGVDGSRFAMGWATLEYEVSDYKLTITRVPEANTPVTVGVNTAFRATLTIDGRPASGDFLYRWEPSTEARFKTNESVSAETSVAFVKTGRAKVWAVALAREGEALTTLAESNQIEIEIVNPDFDISFAPEQGLVGAPVKARVKPSVAGLKEIDFRWELSRNVRLLNESQDRREITFAPQDDQPVEITARARVPVSGEDLGTATAKYVAKKFDVKVAVLGSIEPKPQVWKEGVGLVTVENAIAVHQNVAMRADVTPQVEGTEFRYEWRVNEDSHIVGGSASNEARFNRSQTGTCIATVIVRDQNGLELGRGSGTFAATISEDMMGGGAKAKEAADKIAKAKEIVRKGQLDEAIALAEEAARLNPQNGEAGSLAGQWRNERDTCLAQIEKAKRLIAEGKFPQASNELIVAKNLHGLYKPVLEMDSQIGTEWRAWDTKIQDDLYRIRDASERKEFKRALELAAKRREEGRLGPYEKQLADAEAWARRWEEEKEEKRRILKGAEAKMRQYDFAGALKEFELGFANFDNLWAMSDPEPNYYNRLRSEAIARNNRINELMKYVSDVARDQNARTDLIETQIKNAAEVLSLQPSNAEAKRFRAILERRLADRRSGAAVTSLIKRGNDHFANRRYPEAIGEFTKAIEANPGAAEAYIGRGMARRAAQDYSGALADFNRAIQIDPAGAEGYRGRSMTRRSQNDFNGAIADATRVIELDSGSYRGYLTRGLAREGLKDYDGAISDFSRAIRLNPNYANSFQYRGLILLNRKKDHRGALADFDRAVGLEPTNSTALNNRGVAKERLGDLPGALADYEKAVSVGPGNEMAKRNLTRLRGKLGEQKASDSLPLDMSSVGGKRGQPRIVKGIRIDDLSWIRLASTRENRLSLEIPATSGIRATAVAIVTNLDCATYLEQGKTIARMTVIKTDGTEIFEIRAGVHSSEWNYRAVNPRHRWVEESFIGSDRFLVTFDLARPGRVKAVRFDYVETGAQLWSGNAPGFIVRGVSLLGSGVTGDQPPPAAAPVPSPSTQPSPPTQPGGREKVIFQNGNVYGVSNGPTAPTVFTLTVPHVITSVMTYHWNSGRGTRTGTIALRDANGRTYGPWAVKGTPGQGGVPNANWTCAPNIEIPAGSYTIIDSEPATWSQNSASGGRGMAVVKGYPIVAIARPTSRPKPADLVYVSRFAGKWNSTFGHSKRSMRTLLEFEVDGIKVRGKYTYDQGRIEATLSPDGKTMEGTWLEAPSYKPPQDAGRVIFRLSEDGKHFTGRWWYGQNSDGGDWFGTRIVETGK